MFSVTEKSNNVFENSVWEVSDHIFKDQADSSQD